MRSAKCLFRYARAIDRFDEALLRQVYWPEAVDNHGTYNGPVSGFVEYVIPALREMDQTIHFFGNILIELHGGSASSEAYFFACHRSGTESGEPREFTLGAHHCLRLALDYFEQRLGGTIGTRCRCSHFRSVEALTPNALANSSCESPKVLRAF